MSQIAGEGPSTMLSVNPHAKDGRHLAVSPFADAVQNLIGEEDRRSNLRPLNLPGGQNSDDDRPIELQVAERFRAPLADFPQR